MLCIPNAGHPVRGGGTYQGRTVKKSAKEPPTGNSQKKRQHIGTKIRRIGGGEGSHGDVGCQNAAKDGYDPSVVDFQGIHDQKSGKGDPQKANQAICPGETGETSQNSVVNRL